MGDQMLKTWIALLLCAVLAMAVGASTANAGGGNSGNAKLCQKGGWMSLQGSDGTQFTSQDECVSFGAQGGTIVAKPPCMAGSDNFSGDAEFSVPTTWAGGTITGPYGPSGSIRVEGSSWNSGGFPTGTHVLFTGGLGASAPFQLSFSDPVGSVQLDAMSDVPATSTLTLTAYNASNALVDSGSATVPGFTAGSLSVTSASNNIAYFTVESTLGGFAMTNIVWNCTA